MHIIHDKATTELTTDIQAFGGVLGLLLANEIK